MKSVCDSRLGAARLDLWGGRSVIWDTPSPPPAAKMQFFTASGKSMLCNVRLRTLDLRSTRGLTFFYIRSSLRAIHSHTSRFPTALTTYARLSELDRRDVVWVHVPIAPNDRIIGLGIRTSGMEDDFTSPSVLRNAIWVRGWGPEVECSSGTDEHHHNDSGEHMVCVPIKEYLDCHWDDRWTRLEIQEHAPEAVAAIMQVDMNGRNPLEFTV
ncbi:hypothetical protein J7337_001607 [Fusarium musae]|uniref:Uncharacterized protein n=1 Tax=Fusarium musae TaxID=1042133 RepID=A0A9P8DTV2_9HYPO|nr:hypothetical protein J7337_001607 [Fusarium musae]KAG9508049.1 hypothetical protein J7337_001607 [Fusarium musae]